MPEGDTLYRTAAVLGRVLTGNVVRRASARAGCVQLERVIGSRTTGVQAKGKHLLVAFDCGLTLHTHLQMKGSWHRYRPGERWRLAPDRAVAVLETEAAVAVCFDAPTVELLDSRALPLHPFLSRLGPDLLDPAFDPTEAASRLRSGRQSSVSMAEVLLDQSVVCGIGNVYRSEVLFIARVDPFRMAMSFGEDEARALFMSARDLMLANLGGGPRVTMRGVAGVLPGSTSRAQGRHWVYRRAGLPCRHCGSPVRSGSLGRLPRRLYWCPGCQPAAVAHTDTPPT